MAVFIAAAEDTLRHFRRRFSYSILFGWLQEETGAQESGRQFP
jgi:hypothetical protein